jgi:hypothetical protein
MEYTLGHHTYSCSMDTRWFIVNWLSELFSKYVLYDFLKVFMTSFFWCFFCWQDLWNWCFLYGNLNYNSFDTSTLHLLHGKIINKFSPKSPDLSWPCISLSFIIHMDVSLKFEWLYVANVIRIFAISPQNKHCVSKSKLVCDLKFVWRFESSIFSTFAIYM